MKIAALRKVFLSQLDVEFKIFVVTYNKLKLNRSERNSRK